MEEHYVDGYGDVDAVILAEEDHFDPQNSSRKQAVIESVDPAYVLVEEDSTYEFEDVLNREDHTLFGREKEGRSRFFAYLEDRLDTETEELTEVVFCDDLPEDVTPFTYAATTDSDRLSEIDDHRETYMSETITEYAERSDQPVVAILGAEHTQEGSTLRSNLDDTVTYTVDSLEDTVIEEYHERSRALSV